MNSILALYIILTCEYVQVIAQAYNYIRRKISTRDKNFFIFYAILCSIVNTIAVFDGKYQGVSRILAVVVILIFWFIVALTRYAKLEKCQTKNN